MSASRFIACGMYVPNDDCKTAWQLLFDRFYRIIDPAARVTRQLVFDASESLLRDPALLLGHTCGYPLMTRLSDALVPVCLPCFDLPGSAGKLYSSRFIVPVGSAIETLQQCRGKTVAINSRDSNSGMNVLRYALARLGARPGFFSEVLMTGGHRASIEAVASNRAQLAAIDCVTYQLIADQEPALCSALRVIGFSDRTCGLPLVMPASGYTPATRENLVSALNQALTQLPAVSRSRLHLERFEPVALDAYQSILDFEKYALDSGYAELN